jgi:Flp pilus assembly protein TadG
MRRHPHGQSLVEFALVVPFIILIVMGIIDFGYYVYTYSELENATRRASEFASKAAPTTPECLVLARDEARKSVFLNKIPDSNITITVPAPPKVGDTAVVKIVDYPVQFLTPVGRSFFKNAKFNFTSNRTILSVAPILTSSNNTITCH